MDATCNVQDSIHVFHLVHNMCPGFWVHITSIRGSFFLTIRLQRNRKILKKSWVSCGKLSDPILEGGQIVKVMI